MEGLSEAAHNLITRALDGDREAMREIFDRIEAETGRDALEVLTEILEDLD